MCVCYNMRLWNFKGYGGADKDDIRLLKCELAWLHVESNLNK